MKAISVRQPWAWAIIHGGKDVENRTRNIAGDYRGPVAIHASKGYDELDFYYVSDILAPGDLPEMDAIAFGAVIGVATLWAVHQGVQGAWCCPRDERRYQRWAVPDQWHLCLTNQRPLPEPIPYRGQLGLWALPDDVLPPEFQPSHHTRSNP